MTYFRLFKTRITNSVTISAVHARGHAGELNKPHIATCYLATRRLTELSTFYRL